jgi:hypothetical protein
VQFINEREASDWILMPKQNNPEQVEWVPA